MNSPALTPPIRRWERLVALTRLVCLPRLKPLFDLERLAANESDAGFEWRATTDDPQFLWRRGLPAPGWHMLEIRLSHDQASAGIKLYFDTGSGFREEESLYLSLRTGRLNKRLCFIRHGLRAIRFDPMESAGAFRVEQFKLIWLTPWFAQDRLAQRLANLHPDWLQTPKADVVRKLKRLAGERGVAWLPLALTQYEATFSRLCPSQSYHHWLETHPPLGDDEMSRRMARFHHRPLISILLPVYDPSPSCLRQCLDSVLGQRYPHWQLCIADDASRDPRITAMLRDCVERDDRVRWVQRSVNGHICAASNDALALAQGEYVALLDHDDQLSPDALFHVAEAIQSQPRAQVLYSDEDKIDEHGARFEPHFKPAWNPDLLLSQNYLSHLGVFRTTRVRDVGGFRTGFEGSQDHDLALRCTAGLTADEIVRVPHVLYHWRAGAGSTASAASGKAYTATAGHRAVSEHVAGLASGASVEPGRFPNTYRVCWPLPVPAPLVSLLIPTRNGIDTLKPCVEAILERTDYPAFEVLILDNGSDCERTRHFLEAISADERVRVLSWPEPFNYSAINNYGARHARGELLGLINDDVEPMHAEWLREMVAQASREEIGCVGAKLYYPNGTIQHAGVILGVGGVAGHAHKYFSGNVPGYFSRLHLTQNYSAVTAACLVLRRALFEQVRGLDATNLPVSFNDVDLCLRIREAGYRNLWTPYAELYHHESVSRGSDDTPAKRQRAAAEAQYMRSRWHHCLFDDPAYHPHLTLTHEDFSLR